MTEQAVTDAELIARVLVDDDRHAFSELVRRYQSAIRATLRRLTAGNHALADDLAQETFLLAYRNLKSFRQEARFPTWLYRIATNAFLAHARKRKEELLGDADAEVADDGPGLAHAGEAVGDHARAANLRLDMERALAVLSEGERAAIDWLERALREDGRDHRAGYLADDGFTTRWRPRARAAHAAGLAQTRRGLVMDGRLAGAALALPGTVVDVAHQVTRLLGSRPARSPILRRAWWHWGWRAGQLPHTRCATTDGDGASPGQAEAKPGGRASPSA